MTAFHRALNLQGWSPEVSQGPKHPDWLPSSARQPTTYVENLEESHSACGTAPVIVGRN